jgi:hypothetical protein
VRAANQQKFPRLRNPLLCPEAASQNTRARTRIAKMSRVCFFIWNSDFSPRLFSPRAKTFSFDVPISCRDNYPRRDLPALNFYRARSVMGNEA